MKIIFTYAFLSINLISMSAMQANAATSCGEILAGIYDIRTTTSAEDRVTSFENWFCNSDKVDSNASATLPIEGVPVEFSGELNWAKSRCGATSQTDAERTRFQEVVRTVNAHVVQAWESCMSRRGLQAGLIHTDDPKKFAVTLGWIPFNSDTPVATLIDGIDGFAIDGNATCTSDWLNTDNREIENRRTLLCSRIDEKETIRIAVNANYPTIDELNLLVVAPYEPAIAPPPPTPRDKIVSALSDHQVCHVSYWSEARYNVGTIYRGTSFPFDVSWNGSKWVVSGWHPSVGGRMTFPYPRGEMGVPPSSNEYNHWGETFVIREDGTVFSRTYPDFGGTMTCS